jgi:subtilisin-like proprotein convertase family protein
MQQGQSFDEAQRTLGHDDVATLGYGRSGVDEVAGTGDDYTTTLVYQGVTTSGCDLTVSVDANTGFASCSVGLAFVGGGDHFRITSGTVRLNNATNWYYNQTPNGGPANSPPAIVSIVNQVVAEGDVLNIAISAGDPDAGDTLAFSTANLPAFCTLFDSGNRTADIVCTPGTMDEGTYPILVTVTDNGVPPLDDSTSFDLVVTPDGLDEVVVCSLPAVAIPDNAPAGVSDELVVGNGTATIVDLDVSVGIAHTYVGDLAVALEHVTTGTSVVVIDRPGVPASSFGCSGDNVEAILDDEGTDGPVEDACGAATAIGGTFTPNEPLSAFDGEPVNGTWRLTVSDSVDQDTGTLGDWCVSARVQAIPDTDADGDGVFDSVDNCQTVANPAQIDSDGDGYGNLCDADLNNDCIVNAGDLGLLRSRFFSPDADADFNSDGVVNAADLGILKQAFFAAPGPSALTQSCDDTSRRPASAGG